MTDEEKLEIMQKISQSLLDDQSAGEIFQAIEPLIEAYARRSAKEAVDDYVINLD